MGRIGNAFAISLAVIRSPLAACSIVAAVLIGASAFAWQKFGEQILQSPKYYLSTDNIQVTPPPDWIRADIAREVFRDGALEKIAVHDRELTNKVADAFSVHSWVKQVVQVRKFTDHVVVELAYRQPVAMVEVVTNGKKGLIPVDHRGVILPTADFSPNETRDYLRISVADATTFGVVGTPWGDERVHQAAQIAESWGSKWSSLNLYRIVANPTEDRLDPVDYELQTRGGSRVVWGHAIGMESPGEATAAEKIAQLEKFAATDGPFDKLDPQTRLDVRSGQVTRSVIRNAGHQK